MSWSLELIGKPFDVKATIAATQLPDGIKQTVNQFCDAFATGDGSGSTAVYLKTSGHYGATDAWSSVSEFAIRSIVACTAPATAPPSTA